MKKTISLFLCINILLSIGACSKKAAMTWQEQYDLGVRYLSEGNYQEAIIAFEAAIAIDPQQAEGYVHLAEAYMNTNDFESAARVVNQGIEACGESDSFTVLLSQIRLFKLLHNGMTENTLQREELVFLGHNIDTLSFQESTTLLQQRGYEDSGIDVDWGEKNDVFSVTAGNDTHIVIWESSDRIEWSYSDVHQSAKYPIGIRGINICDTMADVFAKLGFSNGQEISDCIMDISESGTGALVLPGEFFIQEYISEMNCSLLLMADNDVLDGAVDVSIVFHDIGRDFFLEFFFGYADSDSPPDCLTEVRLSRIDVPTTIVDTQNTFE